MSEFSDALARLSAGYYNSQPVSLLNPGGLAADGHVANFPLALQDMGAMAAVMETWIGTLGGDNLNDVIDLRTKIEAQMTAKGALQNLYISADPLVGDDAFDGSTAAKAVKSFGRLSELMGTQTIVIRAFTDVVADEWIDFNNAPKRIVVYGRSTDNTSYVRRKIQSVDALNSSTRPGGWKFEGGGACVELSELDVELATSRAYGFIETRGTSLTGKIGPHVTTRTGAGTAKLFHPVYGSEITHQAASWTVDASAAGYIYNGVAAGSDPNLDPRITSDLTSA